MKKYIAKTNLLFAGKHIAVGDTVELADDDAERLATVVTLVEGEVDAETKAETKAEAEAKARTEAEAKARTEADADVDDDAEAELNALTELNTLIAAFTDSGSNLKKEQLIALGIALGLDVDAEDTKAVIAEKITAHLQQ